jgi:hypothetical protein
VARNNFICLSLLTRSTDRDINDLAAGLYQDAPGNASAAATYGLSLLLQHREHEAVALMRTLEPARLREPGIAFYHGMFLMAARQADEALEYIEIGRRHPMLPEEKTLFDRITAAAAVKTVPSGKSAPPMEENPRSRPPL